MSDDIEPEPSASEQPKPVRQRQPRKRTTKPSAGTKKCRTSAREAQRKPSAYLAKTTKRRPGRGRAVAPAPRNDPFFWVSIIITVGFVAVGIQQAHAGNGVAVFTAFSAAVTTILAAMCRQNKGRK